MNWLRLLIAYFRPAPIVFPFPETLSKVGTSTEICESEWRTTVEVTRIASYQAGLIEGELRGRLALSQEIEAEFGADGKELTAADATRVRQRQLH